MIFTLVDSLDDNEKWGTFHKNGSATGMIGALKRAETDIAIGTITPRRDLHAIFDFTTQYLQDETAWVVPILEPFPHWFALIHLFQPYVWYATIATYVFVSLTVWILGKCSDDEYQTFIQLHDILLVIARMMIGNYPPRFPKSTRLQIVIIMWSIFCLNWFAAYTTSLISMITSTFYGDSVGQSISYSR